jgi:putative hydrolase of HD superfamily
MGGDDELLSSLAALVGHVQDLKQLPRQGWTRHGLDHPESVADHSYGVAILALFFARRLGLDASRAIVMALLHDLPESIIGDATPADRIDRTQHGEAEAQAAQAILSLFGNANELVELCRDYQERRSPEAVLVYELDRLEMAFQAARYEREHAVDLTEFYASTKRRLTLPALVAALHELSERRKI